MIHRATAASIKNKDDPSGKLQTNLLEIAYVTFLIGSPVYIIRPASVNHGIRPLNQPPLYYNNLLQQRFYNQHHTTHHQQNTDQLIETFLINPDMQMMANVHASK